jgi:hypothetical protein
MVLKVPSQAPLQRGQERVYSFVKKNQFYRKKNGASFNISRVEADTINSIASRLTRISFEHDVRFLCRSTYVIDSAKVLGLPIDVRDLRF